MKKLLLIFCLLFIADSAIVAQVVHTHHTLKTGLPPGVIMTDSSYSGEMVIDTAFNGGSKDSLAIGDSVRSSVNYGPLIVDGSHHLAQTSLTGTTGKIYTSNGTVSAPTFQDGGLTFLLHVPTVSDQNLVNPVTSGIPPLTLKSAVLSDTNAFEVYNYAASPLFIVDSGGKINTYRGLNLYTTTNPIGLWSGSSLDYGTSGYVLTSQGPGATPIWASVSGGTGTVTSVDGSGGSTGLTLSGGPITTSGTLTLGGKLNEVSGGTNQSSYATGDILYASASNTLSKLAIGSTGKVLTVASGIPSWATPSFSGSLTATTMDLNTNGSTVKDTVPGNILIAGTTKPGSATFKYVINAADIPSNQVVTRWMVWITIGGKNTDGASARTINWRINVNSTDKAGADNSLSVPTATPWWRVMSIYCSTALAVGDTIGFKLWASAANLIDFRYVTLYIVPCLYGSTSGMVGGVWGASTSIATLSGANSGVSYVAVNLGSTPGFYDVTTASSNGSLNNQACFMLGSGNRVQIFNALTDVNDAASSSGTAASSQLLSVSSSNKFFRYLYWYH